MRGRKLTKQATDGFRLPSLAAVAGRDKFHRIPNREEIKERQAKRHIHVENFDFYTITVRKRSKEKWAARRTVRIINPDEGSGECDEGWKNGHQLFCKEVKKVRNILDSCIPSVEAEV